MAQRKTWYEWMDEVNKIVERRCGCGAEDLVDFPYRDWYDDDARPATAAMAAIRNQEE